MSVSRVCLNASVALADIYSCKALFDSAFQAAIESGSSKDIAVCEQLKQSLIQKIEQLELYIEPDAYKKQLIRLKILERKQVEGEHFTQDDLLFIYEVNSVIDRSKEGDKIAERINELRNSRDLEQDVSIIFECTPGQIARSIDQINESTRAYIGPLEVGVFNHLPGTVDCIYTQFPESRVHRENLEIGGKTKEELVQLFKIKGFRVNSASVSAIESNSWTTLKNTEEIKLIRLTVAQLGFLSGATLKQIFARATELGLELCPAEVGPYYRLKYKDGLIDEWVSIGMRQIVSKVGGRAMFTIGRRNDGLFLNVEWVLLSDKYDAGRQFVFRLRKEA